MQQRSYVDAAGILRTVFTEFRYDALGRRVLTRTRYDQYCQPDETHGTCLPSVDRTVWDGDQVLLEQRAVNYAGETDPYHLCGQDEVPSGNCVENPKPPVRWAQTALEAESSYGIPWAGQVRYTHAGGIDQPLAVWASQLQGVGLVPHWSWRGLPKDGTYLGAAPQVVVAWPARSQDAYRAGDARAPDAVVANYWLGSVLDGAENPTGLVYQRNRYYDPTTGRFTQEDPIGLAGGLNLYGFAGGDPVNFSDPFGLCPPTDSNVQDCASVEFWRNRAGNASFAGRIGNSMMAGFAATGETAIAEIQGQSVGGCGTEYLCGNGPPVGRGFNNNRLLNGFKIGRHVVAVDAEIGGSGLGQVHVQLKNAGKILIESMDDLSGLPNKVAKNATVREAIAKGFEWLEKMKP